MSTVKKNITSKRIQQLASISESLFHTKDLANLWHIKDANLLYTTLKRYVQQGLLYRIYRGLYSLKPIHQLDPLLLGIKVLHRYAYISTETVLVERGIIQQHSHQITLVSSVSKQFIINNHYYRSRKLSDQYLYNPIGIENKDGINIAAPARAIADLLYFNPRANFDNRQLIDWTGVKQIQKEIGY